MRISDWIQTCALPISLERPVAGMQPRKRPEVEMVVMAMADQHSVDPGQVLEGDARRGDAPGAGKGDGAGAVGPDRIGQYVAAGCLDEHRSMPDHRHHQRSEEHTSELQSLMRISYAVFCLK